MAPGRARLAHSASATHAQRWLAITPGSPQGYVSGPIGVSEVSSSANRRRPRAGLRPRENITGGGMVVLSLGFDEPAPQCKLSAERRRGAGPSGRPPTTSAACALATGYTRPTRWPHPRLSVARAGPQCRSPAAPARGHPNANVRIAHLDSRQAPRRTARFRITGRFLCVIVTRRCRVVPREQELLR